MRTRIFVVILHGYARQLKELSEPQSNLKGILVAHY